MNGTWDDRKSHTFEGVTPAVFGDMVVGRVEVNSVGLCMWFLHGVAPDGDRYLIECREGTSSEEETRDLCVAAVESKLLRGELRRRG